MIDQEISGDEVSPGGLFRRNALAIFATVLSMGSFLLNDTLVKLSSDDLPLTQIVVIRGLFATGILLGAVFVMGEGAGLRRMADPNVMWRGLMEALGTFFFLTALFNMPIANVTTLFQCVPFLMTILAVIFLGEKVGLRRWTAIGIGFLGVLLVMRPDTDSFNIYSVSILAAALVIAVRDILTRRIDSDIPTSVISFVTSLFVLVAAAAASPFETWVLIGMGEVVWLAMASICIVVGYYSIVFALRVGDISVVAPFRYTVIIFSILSGYLVWGDVPQITSVFGIVLITGSGIFVFLREWRLGKHAPEPIRRDPGEGV